jgi:hypothetical protein
MQRATVSAGETGAACGAPTGSKCDAESDSIAIRVGQD